MRRLCIIALYFICYAKSESFLGFVYNRDNYDFNPSFVYQIDNEETYEKVINDRTKTVLVTYYVSEEWCCKF